MVTIDLLLRECINEGFSRLIQYFELVDNLLGWKIITTIYAWIEGGSTSPVLISLVLATEKQKVIFIEVCQLCYIFFINSQYHVFLHHMQGLCR